MTLFKEQRETVGQLWLNSLLRKKTRKIQLKTLDAFESALIVFDASTEKCYEQAKAFSKQLINNGTKVKAIGFLNADKRELPYIGEKVFTFVTLQDFSFFFLPKSPDLKELVETPFDALFVLSSQSFFPLKVLISLSKASFKTGFAGMWGSALDLTFEMPDHDNIELVKQINHYLGGMRVNSER